MLWTLLIGLFIGIVAKFMMPGKDPGGFIITALLGVAGSMLAHFIGAQAGWYREGEPAGFIAGVVGAVILLVIYRAMAGKGNRVTHNTRGGF
ncbi:MAG TPA: GlsB/YeaQ/YmgE family stress response membrane protein [Bacteriovoracaceae bacterium]|nr:GlsB/YeaQ/YmgE family stress response membrane protein [Bacteriovoracaceae bacterium]